jgi:hypothetical protein
VRVKNFPERVAAMLFEGLVFPVAFELPRLHTLLLSVVIKELELHIKLTEDLLPEKAVQFYHSLRNVRLRLSFVKFYVDLSAEARAPFFVILISLVVVGFIERNIFEVVHKRLQKLVINVIQEVAFRVDGNEHQGRVDKIGHKAKLVFRVVQLHLISLVLLKVPGQS